MIWIILGLLPILLGFLYLFALDPGAVIFSISVTALLSFCAYAIVYGAAQLVGAQ